MHRLILWILAIGLVASCAPTTQQQNVPATQDQGPTTLQLTRGAISVSLERPANWRHYPASDRVVLSEHRQAMDGSGRLTGFVANLWLYQPQIESNTDFITGRTDDDADATKADTAEALHQMLQAHSPQQGVRVSAPLSFQWHGHNAGAYSISAPNETRTVVVAIDLQQGETMTLLMLNLSASAVDFERLDTVMDELLGQFVVNEEPMGADSLTDHIAQALATQTNSSAMEASPSTP